jgi:hypothetical protein
MNEWINHWLWKWSNSLHRGPIWGTRSGGSFTVDFKRKVRLFYQETLFLWGGWWLQKMCKRRLWKWASLFTEAPLDNLVGGPFTWDCRDKWKMAREMEHLSLWELCEWNLEEAILYWGPWRACRGKLWRQASLSLHRGPVGEPGGVFVYWGLWQTVKECSVN